MKDIGIFQLTYFDSLAYLKKNIIFIFISGSVKKQLGSGFKFLAGSGFNENGFETLPSSNL